MFMNALDGSIVNVALPDIQKSLGFNQSGLTWVVDAYLISFGSFLLLAGRLGDLIGRKKVFLAGVALFVLASIACGSADDQTMLIVARFIQGIGGALSSSVIVAIIVTEFPSPLERGKAMSAYVFVAVGGGSIGLLAGGVLTQFLSWHWIFFVNVPIGIATLILGRFLIVENVGLGIKQGVDWVGSALITLSVMVAIYGVVTATTYGWLSAHTLGILGAAVALFVFFIVLESRLANPIMPLRILKLRTLTSTAVIRGLLITGMFSTFFIGALYFEHVLGYSPVKTGLAFLPQALFMAALSTGHHGEARGPLRSQSCDVPGHGHGDGGVDSVRRRWPTRQLLPPDLHRLPVAGRRRRALLHAAATDRDVGSTQRRRRSRDRASSTCHSRWPALSGWPS